MTQESWSYGQAGGPGQGLSRFQIQGGPTPSIPIWAAGSMVSSVPAHLMPLQGSTYRYGTFVAGGTKNMVTNGQVQYAIPAVALTREETLRLKLGGGAVDVFTDAFYAFTASFQLETFTEFDLMVNGELYLFPVGGTTGTLYGAFKEDFAQAAASTVDVTHLSNLVKGNGTTFTTDALAHAYGYTPSGNKIIPGDIIGIGAPGSRQWHRIVAVNAAAGAGALTIYPAYQGATAAALAYIVIRTGYGSTSRLLYINPNPNTTVAYYAGNRRNAINEGYIEAVFVDHRMGPQATPSATDVLAVDIAYYKGFLLYGSGGSIGWSVAGFPTAIPFGATDFPSGNITVVDNQDTFVSFEFLGDQLVAIFRKGIWLVQATGIVPEFNFYKLPEAIGAITQGITDPEVVTSISYARPSCTGRGAVYYVAIDGLRQLTGGVSGLMSSPVANLNAVIPNELFRPGSCLSWEPTTDSVFWRAGGPTLAAAVMDVPHKSWSIVDLGPPNIPGGADVIGFTAGVTLSTLIADPIRVQRFGGWSQGFHFSQKQEFDIDQAGVCLPWLWASPIIDMGQIYSAFKFGGFLVMARAALGASSPTLTWALYSGASPYNLTLRQTSTLNYTYGFTDSRQVIGKTLDDAYAAIVLSGDKWVELAGILALSSESAARR